MSERRWLRKLVQKLICSCLFAGKHWLGCLTVVLLLAGLATLAVCETLEDAAYIGSVLSGFAAVLAFIWLIASLRLQSKELALQRHELSLQRRAIELQTEEIEGMREYAALDQVATIVSAAVLRLSESDSGVTRPEQLFPATMPTPEWKVLLESTVPEKVIEAYKTWGTKFAAATQFLAAMTLAAKLYLKATGIAVDYDLPDAKFFYDNKTLIEKIPHISQYFHSTYLVAECVFRLEPGMKSLNLAEVAAMKMLLGEDIFERKSVDELIAYHRARGLKGPAIARLDRTFGSHLQGA